MEGLRLDIVTPDKVVLQAEVDYVGASGVDGEFGVMPGHAPMLSALRIGELYYRKGSETVHAFVSGGVAEVSGNKVTVLAESAELASDINVERAEQARERAERRLADVKPDTDVARASMALSRAVARLHIASLR